MVSGVRQEDEYIVIQYLNRTENYPIEKLCKKLHINRSSYYKWLKREPSTKQLENEQIIEWIKELYEEQNGILGYRQMTITLNRERERNTLQQEKNTQINADTTSEISMQEEEIQLHIFKA